MRYLCAFAVGVVLALAGGSRQDTWTPVGDLVGARRDHAAVLLLDGQVLVVGGSTTPAGAELYDPSTRLFTAVGPTVTAHGPGLTATRLNDGRVLIVGGFGAPAGSELYQPATRSFAATGANRPRRSHTATLLADGRVLIAGGYGPDARTLDSAELYDPTTGVYTPTGSLAAHRGAAAAALLPDGRVLIVGGEGAGSACPATAEIYDPSLGRFAISVSMVSARCAFWWSEAPVLPGGKVLVAGGLDAAGGTLRSAELFDPATMTFAATGSMMVAHGNHTVTALPDGRVLVAGGRAAAGVSAATEIFDPATETFTAAGSMTVLREQHAATLLSTGDVLVTGGFNFAERRDLAAAETFGVRGGVLIDFERRRVPPAEPWADAFDIYRGLGVTFPSHPVILPSAALSSGFQSLIQADPRAPRPERRCGPLEIALDPALGARRVSFEARNVGLIGIPVLITVTGRHAAGGVVARVSRTSESRLGRLQPVELIDLVAAPSARPIVRVTVAYGMCPPQVVIDNLRVSAVR